MTRGPRPMLPITLGRILQPRQTICSAFSTLLTWSRDTISKAWLTAGFAGWTYQAVETVPCDRAFMDLGSAERLLRPANMLASTALLTIEVGSPC
jgi:hypothetical protein